MKTYLITVVGCFCFFGMNLQAQYVIPNTNIYYNNGKVGIRTNNPTATLDILGYNGTANDRNFRVKFFLNSDPYVGEAELSGIVHVPSLAGGNGWTALYAKQGNASKAGVFEGDVLIYGSLKSKEVKVTLNEFPDFVFKENYQLRSIAELERYIIENSHLPDIPSENEVKEKGIDLGEFNAKLLQKIEELTLYVIEQGKQNEALKQQMQIQQKEIEELKKSR